MGHRDDLWDEYVNTRDPVVREELILQNIPLVRHVLGRLAVPALSDDTYRDLVGQGILGLIDAVDRFEPDRGWRFSTYATLRIRGHILDSLRAMDMLPRGARKRVKGIERAISRLRMELRREPFENEVANAMNLDLKSYRAALVEASCTVISIDAAIEADGYEQGSTYRDFLCDQDAPNPEETLEKTELHQRLTDAFRQLSERLQVLLALYYYEGLTMKEIGRVLDLSESRVSQLHGRAVIRLRAALDQEESVQTKAPAARVTGPVSLPVFAAN